MGFFSISGNEKSQEKEVNIFNALELVILAGAPITWLLETR
jgi:hypothetical protein